jgi:SAM-dependent methyltransferase
MRQVPSQSARTGVTRGRPQSDTTVGRVYWDAVAAEWRATHRHWLWCRHSDAVNAALCVRWLPPGNTGNLLKTDLFDEAISEGLYPVLAGRASRVIGVDLSLGVASAAVARYRGLRALSADTRYLPFADGSFQTVVSISTLDHFGTSADIARSLCEIHRVLGKDDHLILTLDNRTNPLVALRNALPFQLLNRLGLVPYAVGATYGLDGVRVALELAGFKVLEATTILHCPRACAVALAWLLERHAGGRLRRAFLNALMACEVLADWPTRALSGYFVAVRAVRL